VKVLKIAWPDWHYSFAFKTEKFVPDELRTEKRKQ
jgi:hypothetical protein